MIKILDSGDIIIKNTISCRETYIIDLDNIEMKIYDKGNKILLVLDSKVASK